MQEIIKTDNLVFCYPDREKNALDGVTISVNEGEFVALLGHNGSGKSTLCKHFNSILLPSGGSCTVCGIDTKIEERLLELRQHAGMVFQNPDNQLVAAVVEEDVAFGLENLGVPQDEIRERVDEALKEVGMYEFRLHAPHKLSGGQKQRVAIAGVIAMKPKLIIFDEPTAMLDPRGRKEVIETIDELNEKDGITVVLVTHYMEEAVGADRIFVMSGGKVLTSGTPREVFSQVKILEQAGLDVPQSTRLAYVLKQRGLNINESVLTVDECVDAVISLMGGEGR